MKILKYIFLLILLACIAATVFIATQKNDFSIKQSVVINVPKPIVFNYVNDYKNWEDWFLDKKNDEGLQLQYSDISVGRGSHLSWSGKNGDGKMQTLFVLPADLPLKNLHSCRLSSPHLFRLEQPELIFVQ